MKTMKKLLVIVLAIATAAMLAVPAMASTVPDELIDTSKKGSITVHKYEYTGNGGSAGTGLSTNAVPDGAKDLAGVTFTLYKVMDVNTMLGYYNGTNTDTVTVANYVADGAIIESKVVDGVTNRTATTGNDGLATFSNLELGMYVLIETDKPAKVTGASDPVLISVPMVNSDVTTTGNNNNSKWMYNIYVFPKNSTSEGNVELTKKDENGNALAGVTFQLWQKSGSTYAKVTGATGTGVTATGTGKCLFENLTQGEYCITEESAPVGYIVDSRPIYFTVTADNTVTYNATLTENTGVTAHTDGKTLTITIKNEKPNLDKTVKENGGDYDWTNHDAVYSVGDTIAYQINVKVPSNLADLKTFKVTDTPTHLKDVVNSIQITYGSNVTYATSSYSASASGDGFVIDFLPQGVSATDLAKIAGQTITIKYNATLLSTATIAGTGNPNTADLEYSNQINPTKTPDDETPDEPGSDHIKDSAIVYTFALQINKYKDSVDSSNKLANVEFALLDGENGTAVEVFEVAKGSYRLPVAGDTSTTTTLTTDSNGQIIINGLENGDYWLKETKTVNGYNLLSKPIKVTLSVSAQTTWETESEYDSQGNLVKRTYTSSTYTFSGGDTTTTGIYSTDIINKKGFTLPQTGGLGTLTLSVIGCALVLGGALVLVNSKKRAK